MKNYVTGFLFSNNRSSLALIKKINPCWQRGLFNGIGGKIEPGESPSNAMTREFFEETGVNIAENQWQCFAQIHRPEQYHVKFYVAFSDQVFTVQTVEAEQVELFSINSLPQNIIPNLPWLIPLALDRQADFSSPICITEIATERVAP